MSLSKGRHRGGVINRSSAKYVGLGTQACRPDVLSLNSLPDVAEKIEWREKYLVFVLLM